FALADRLVVMHAGRIEQADSPTVVWQQPANAFVARFLGWNVTRAFSSEVAAVRPEAGPVVDHGPVEGLVLPPTCRRGHFLLDVRVDNLEPVDGTVQVEVPVDAIDVPHVGDRIRLAADPDALVNFD